jgi:serine phosphatase RsbU (regulator of sigma subunit)
MLTPEWVSVPQEIHVTFANNWRSLVADVSGHGIPAALISSMIKVAMQSVAICAHDPAQVLGGLNRILSSEAPGQLASAAYVCIDTENRKALYSAAGHPSLLCWRNDGFRGGCVCPSAHDRYQWRP